MKTIFISLLLLTNLTLAKGQVLMSLIFGDKLNNGKVEFGLDGGVNFPSIRGLEDGSTQGIFNIGFYFDIKTKNPNWLFNTGVLVKSSLGEAGLPVYSLGNPDLDNAFVEGEVFRKINYFNVPIAMKYLLSERIFVLGGIQPALRAKAYDIFTSTVEDNDLEYKNDIGDDIYRIDVGLLGGMGYRVTKGYGMNLTLRYYYGLTNIVKNESAPQQYNTSWYLSVGIPIGVKKARARMEEKANKETAQD